MKVDLLNKGTIKENNDGNKYIEFSNKLYRQKQINQYSVGTKIEEEIRQVSNKRSNGQNAYWHAVCFPIFAEEIGLAFWEAKSYCKGRFLKPVIKTFEFNGKKIEIEIMKESSKLNKIEGNEFTRDMRQFAKSKGWDIPTPCQAGYSCYPELCENCAEYNQFIN